MAEIILTASGLSPTEVLPELPRQPGTFAYLERVPNHRLTESEVESAVRIVEYEPGLDISSWERGRVFCASWELSWSRSALVYTGEKRELAGFQAGPSLEDYPRTETSVLLWGKRAGESYLELQVPRRLQYPITSDRVALRIAEWHDDTGELAAWRAVRVEAHKP